VKVNLHEKTKKSKKQKNLLLPALILTTGIALIEKLTTKNSKNNAAKIKNIVKQNSYRKLVEKLQQYVKEPKQLDAIKDNIMNLLPSLLQAGLFDDLARKIV
jgi:hypothetical protein